MIPNKFEFAQTPWPEALRAAIRDPAQLLRHLDLPPEPAAAARHDFPLLVPPHWLSLIEPGMRDDPLLLQVWPTRAEDEDEAGLRDPVGDNHAEQAPGVIHKYHGRVLLIAQGGCAINCRYCFRRHFPYADSLAKRGRWQSALDYLAEHDDVSEVILSGGDPLLGNDEQLDALIDGLNALPHIRRLRIHSRIPVVLPERITSDLIKLFARFDGECVMVIHANHANEIGPALRERCQAMRAAGLHLLNQSVLLAGVNDELAAQIDLQEAVFAAGVLPYYLHVLDRVQGASHFLVSDRHAKALHEQMRRRLPGYLVPRLSRETAGEPYKTLL